MEHIRGGIFQLGYHNYSLSLIHNRIFLQAINIVPFVYQILYICQLMEPNASLLMLLTISDISEERVVFAFLKELDDLAPDQVHWYRNKGENGKAEFIWEDKKLKQWSLIGKDEDLKIIWTELITETKLLYSWRETIDVKFTIPLLTEKIILADYQTIEGIPNCAEDRESKEYICNSYPYDISFLIGEENNCKFIEGYKHNSKIRPIIPTGLLSEDFLNNKLKEKVHAVVVSRGVHFELKGNRTDADGDTDRLIGFIQMGRNFKEKHDICIRNLEGDKILGTGGIDLETGKWAIELTEPAGRGQFLIRNKENGGHYCGQKYYLIKDIKFDTNIIHTVLVDLYGRKINIINNEETTSQITQSIIWNSSSAPDNRESELVLSDRLTSILLSLGKKIIFNDPYFLGNFEEKNGELIIKSKSQQIFLNALITAIAKAQIEELIFIGSWRKIKTVVDSQESFIKMYTLLYRVIKRTFAKHSLFKLSKFEVVFSKQNFHDRYWMTKPPESGAIYHVSNSINGAFESGELRVMPLTELDVLRIKPKITERYDEGEKFDIIS